MFKKDLRNLMIAAKNTCEQKDFDRHRDREYRIWLMSPVVVKKLDLRFEERSLTDLQNEMINSVVFQAEKSYKTSQEYSDAENVLELCKENIERLKVAMGHIRTNKMEEAVDLLVESWTMQKRISQECLQHQYLVDTPKEMCEEICLEDFMKNNILRLQVWEAARAELNRAQSGRERHKIFVRHMVRFFRRKLGGKTRGRIKSFVKSKV